jgi:hypothetical protein
MSYEDSIIEVHSLPDNLLKLLECVEKINVSSLENKNKLLEVLSSVIHLEINTLYIDAYTHCAPVIEEFNKSAATPKTTVTPFIKTVAKKDETLL